MQGDRKKCTYEPGCAVEFVVTSPALIQNGNILLTSIRNNIQVDSFNDKRRPYQCAYRLWQFRMYPFWDESAYKGGTGSEKGPLTDDSVVYLNDNYVVNKCSYYNKALNLIWGEDKVTPDFIEFCKEELQFDPPEWTQQPRDYRALSAEEKEQWRLEREAKRKAKVDAAPHWAEGWDIVPDVIDNFENKINVEVRNPFCNELTIKVFYRSKGFTIGDQVKVEGKGFGDKQWMNL